MNVLEYIQELSRSPRSRRSIGHIEQLPPREPQFGELAAPLAAPLPQLLAARGMGRLYAHQVEAIERVRAGRDVVIVTATASGKTLCYNLPVIEACLRHPQTSAIYLFPTKALCQDQLGSLQDLMFGQPRLQEAVRPAIYDGDTPTTNRRRIKSEANVVLTNPDMLHVGILPHHAKWGRFFSDLKYIVIDEVHTYRGIFGANVACVLRRVVRTCRHYGAEPTFICASATVANPGELAEKLLGRPVEVIDNDGSPRGRKFFLLWNPPYLDRDHVSRRSASDETTELMAGLIAAGAQTISFTRTRLAAELIYRSVRSRFERQRSPLTEQIRAYRGGYLPNERREIEQQLFNGQLKGVVSTNALELGIDVGSLDAAILTGYPGTIASTWQQAGRAGRRSDESLAVLVAHNDPIDQYLMRHPEYFFGRSPEHAVVDPENPYILQNHLRAAAFELPLADTDRELFGPLTLPIAEALRDAEQLNELGGRFYATSPLSPAHEFSLRHMSDNTFAIIERIDAEGSGFRVQSAISSSPLTTHRSPLAPPGYRVIANVDAISAPELVYPEAVYLHDGETFLVRKLDLQGKLAYVDRVETDYYTQAILESSVKVRGERESRRLGEPCDSPLTPHPSPSSTTVRFGDLDVSWKTVAFKKIKFETRENLGMGPVDIPAQNLATTGFWLVPGAALLEPVKSRGLRPTEGLVGIRNLMIQALPIIAMCDPRDVSGVVDSSNLGAAAVFLYDRYPGGLGYTEKGYAEMERLLVICREMVDQCGCPDGCPSCVGLPNLRPAIHSDPDLTRGYPIPNKQAAQAILHEIGQKYFTPCLHPA